MGLLQVTGLQNSLNKTPVRACTSRHHLHFAFLWQPSPGSPEHMHPIQLYSLGPSPAHEPPRAPLTPLPLTPPATFPPAQCYFTPPRTQVALRCSQNSPTRSWCRDEVRRAPRRGNEPGNYGKRDIQQEASPACVWLQAWRVLDPPFPEAGRT